MKKTNLTRQINSAYALTISHRLAITSVNTCKTETTLGTLCLPELIDFYPSSKRS
jgi:hypothetical protein